LMYCNSLMSKPLTSIIIGDTACTIVWIARTSQ
jgi:hypothetical protein